MCDCIEVRMGSYDNIITLENPFTGKNVDIDKCISNEIRWLWDNDIKTLASCCGHNKVVPTVMVPKEDYDKMLDLGYNVWENPIKGEKNGFVLKGM